ncbi:MAG: sodium:solute symporter family protein [Gammaproteobacteria bacterium]|jgi:solute:Na+ symporter, SSS family|nr:sodium:solute symporter family protein [Gammaproteobacteria bacterium]MBU0772272.1 sodium:solute symporter family protein [Gammaproteobacteria bacterium]MBU0857883.1 sodium:solute symporter family protein [Gammaproteobacteria bacterium]MBU1848399.1 sodium:solute symporter family protein [Gammaproteobacteria bacterium]
MLIWFVVLYLMVSVGIGLFAATRVHNARDFAVAGRTLPLPVVIATVFATWFGSEAVFGVSAQFVTDGLGGVVADPFGASLCLVIAGLFFASKLYKLNILTVGDYYRMRYNRPVELITTVCIIISYLGWVSAQIKAMGLVLTIVTHGAVSEEVGMVLGALIVVTYTTFGGMFSVAILDFVQMAVSIGGLLYIGYVVSGLTGGVAPVIEHAAAAGKLDFFPPADMRLWLAFIGTGLTMMLGSIPQQDVFQRITSAKTARIAVIGSIVGALIYFGVTFIPMFIAYSATLIDPAGMGRLMEDDSQRVLPMLILQHTPMLAQVLFFGAVLSAIMSTASATLLAPSITFAENIVKSFVPTLDDRRLLYVMRVAIVVFAFAVLMVALNTESTIFAMVENAYKVTLVGAFVPLFFGAYWRRASTQGALAAIVGGISSWLLIEFIVGDASVVPAQLFGLLVSATGMVVGSLLPQWVGRRLPHEPLHAELHHHAAAGTHHVSGAPHRH